MSLDLPLVSIVMPIRNEAPYLDAAMDAIDRQTYPRERVEILVVDGGSTDATVTMAAERSRHDPRIRLLGGDGVNTPAAMNLGIEASVGTYVAKVDGHGWMSDGFIAEAVAALDSDNTIGCVGGRIAPVASNTVEQAVQIARFSRLGVGSGIYTAADVIKDIDTVQCGVYRRTTLIEAGCFDPALQFGEDEEVNFRVRQLGARIVYLPTMKFFYHVRPTLRSLFRQYFNYGRARVAVVRKHRAFLRPKHLVPAVVVLMLASAAPIALVGWPLVGAALIAAYVVALAVSGVVLARRRRFGRPDLVAAGLGCIHLGYGFGTLVGLADAVRR